MLVYERQSVGTRHPRTHTHEAAHFGLLENWSAVEIQMSVVHNCLNIRVSVVDAKR